VPTRRLYTCLTLAPLAAAAALSLVRAIRLVGAPYELGYGEGLVLWQALHITTPSTVYHPISSFPFVAGLYPPFFMLATWSLNKVVGDIQLAGRLMAFSVFIATLGALAGLVRSTLPARLDPAAKWSAALAAVLLAASVSSIRESVPNARVDGLGLLLAVVGLWIFVSARGSFRKEVLAFMCFVAAVFTKQTFIAAPLACLIVTAAVDRRKALRLALIATVAGLVPLAWLMYLTNGEILIHLFVYTRNHFSALRMVTLLSENIRELLPLVALAVVVPWVLRSEATTCLSVYLVCALLISLTSGKVGSAPYYFIEWNAACCALAGCCFGFVLDRWSERSLRPLVTVAAILLAGFGLLESVASANQALRFTQGAARLETARLDETSQVLSLVKTTQGPVYSDDLTILVKAGRDIPCEPFIMSELARRGRWNMAPFVDQIRGGYYAMLVAQADVSTNELVPREIQQAVAATYRLVVTIGDYRIYSPASSVHADPRN
jgi:hypothetical protein